MREEEHYDAGDEETNDGTLPGLHVAEKKTKGAPKPGSDQDPEFCAWWSEYKDKSGKGAARTAWVKARKIATFEQLMDGLRRYNTLSPRVKNGYIKGPAAWLNQEFWLNEYDAPQPHQVASGDGYQPYSNTSDFEGDF